MSFKSKALLLNLFLLFAFFGEVFIKFSDYIADVDDIKCEAGYVESLVSKRSSSRWFYLVDSAKEISADSFNVDKGKPYSLVIDGVYQANNQVSTLCYLKVRRFVFFEQYYVIYFGRGSVFENDEIDINETVADVNFRVLLYFLFKVFLFSVLLFFNLREE
ncbi:hypothetical protein [Rheinheimera fenheensis]|uniref:hypothetical protein n=1 Tax=Rheinheimera fenheensis TaxID=3152295 RepID=UPI00325F050E